MTARVLEGQLALDLFAAPLKAPGPTWDDVQKGRAELVDVHEPCDRCAAFRDRFGFGYWLGGECQHNARSYAFPMRQADGRCKRHVIRWKNRADGNPA